MPMSADPTRAVLGAWTGLPTEQARPFVASLRATGYDGRIVLFVGRTAFMDLDLLASYGVQIVEVDDDYVPPVPPAVLGGLRRLRGAPGLARLYRLGYRVAGSAWRVGSPGSHGAASLEFALQAERGVPRFLPDGSHPRAECYAGSRANRTEERRFAIVRLA